MSTDPQVLQHLHWKRMFENVHLSTRKYIYIYNMVPAMKAVTPEHENTFAKGVGESDY